jgi:hypothetical integral membrane protein (TIGR02206 family)
MLNAIGDWFSGNRDNHLPGKGLFSPLHIILIILFFTIIIFNIYYSKKNKKYADKVVLICCIVMPISRLIRMIMEVCFGLKEPLEALPFHLCHIMAFVIPLVYFKKWTKAFPCVMFYGMLGGTMTFLFGDYYKYNVLNFYDIESIILHVMLAMSATSSLMKGDFKFTPFNITLIPIFLVLLAGWASVGNYLFDTNYMYIRENGLPFKLLPGHFLFTYALIAGVIFFFMYLPFIIKYFKNKKENKNSASN